MTMCEGDGPSRSDYRQFSENEIRRIVRDELSKREAPRRDVEIERLRGELQASDQAEANAFRNRDSAIAENERLRALLYLVPRDLVKEIDDELVGAHSANGDA